LKVLITAFGFEVAVAWALVVAVDVIVEQAENTDVLDVVDVTNVVELSAVELGEEKVTVELVDNWLLELELVTMLEVVEDKTLDEELDETSKGPVF
jgi:hypothetical protein